MYDYVIVGAGSAGCVSRRGSREDPETERPAARGRAAGRQPERPRAARLPPARPHRGRLGLPLGARAELQRPPDLAAPRPRARRLLLDQRDGLHPRQPARLRRMGRAGLGLGRPLPLLPQGRGQRARRLGVARGRRPAAGLRPALWQRDLARLRRGRRRSGPGPQRRLQRRRAGRRRHVPGDPARRHARERRRLLPAPGERASEPDRDALHARQPRALRGQARGRGRGEPARSGAGAACRARGDPLRRRLQLTAAADALRGRPGRAPDDARSRGAARPAGGG